MVGPNTSGWDDLGIALRKAREEAGLKLKDIPILTPGHLSRMERGLARPTEQVARTYESVTSAVGLVSAFTRLEAGDRSPPMAHRDPNRYYEKEHLLEELDSIIKVGKDGVHVIERRSIRSLNNPLPRIRINQGLFELAGRPPGTQGYIRRTRSYRPR